MKSRFLRGLLLICILFPVLDAVADCTDIIVGKKVSRDGSVITSQTGCCTECRVHVVPSLTFKSGTQAPVYWGMQDVKKPFGPPYGQILGYIPQAEKTFAYFHTGYPQMNEYQLAIGETTLSQRDELKPFQGRSRSHQPALGKQMMTIEQAQLIALQRCKTAREAIKLITDLVDRYGFLPSAGQCGSEGLCIADPNEAWVLEVLSVGPDWDPKIGKPGAIWAAQRVPDDHILIMPNWSIIKEIHLDSPDFMASKNYMQFAVDRGWYNPASGKPFIWQDVYAPKPQPGQVSRMWLFYRTFAPSYKKWPEKERCLPSDFPFSIQPERKLSVQDVIAFQRSTYEGTRYDMAESPRWNVSDGKGGSVRSPLATPFPTMAMQKLLDIPWNSPVADGGYGMVAQLRSWLPDPIGGIYWFYLDNQYVSTYVPIYAGVKRLSPLYMTYDIDKYSDDSARWAIDFAENLLYLNWQEAIGDLRAVRDPLEADFFATQTAIETEMQDLYKISPERAKDFMTDLTILRQERIVKMYHDLRDLLISKYTNNNLLR